MIDWLMGAIPHFVIISCICYIAHHVINNSKKAKAQDKRMAKLDAGQMTDWDEYLSKLCRITGKNAHELMTIAAQEAGMDSSKSRISKDFRAFIHSPEGDLPGYVIHFLKKGKDYIDSVEEGPGRPKNMVPSLF